jgi:hypothetical protein
MTIAEASRVAALEDDLTLDALRLNGAALNARIASMVTAADLERTIDGASTLTLTVFDPDRRLLRSGIFGDVIDVELDGLWFRLVKVSKAGDTLTLTFEDRIVSMLRDRDSYRKARRGTVTRAEFALSLVREIQPAIDFISPDLHVKQTTIVDSTTRKARDKNRERGIADDVTLKIGWNGSRNATRSQRDMMERVLSLAFKLRAGPRATKALVEACIVESSFQDLPGGDASSVGLLQLLDLHYGGSVSQRRDVTKIVTDFLKVGFTGRGGAIDLARTNPGWSAGTVAQAVQGSAYGSRYDDVGDQADAVIAAWGGVTSGGSITTAKKYEFTRGSPGKREDTWTAIRRLAAEVNWRCFVVGDAVYFIGDDDLFASRARFTLREDLGGVGDVSFDYDYGKKVAEATVTCRASRWIAPPGTVVILDDLGMADGRWLVGSIRRSLFDRQTEISLVKPMTPKPEPSAGTTSTTSNASGTPGRSGPVRTKLVEWALSRTNRSISIRCRTPRTCRR